MFMFYTQLFSAFVILALVTHVIFPVPNIYYFRSAPYRRAELIVTLVALRFGFGGR